MSNYNSRKSKNDKDSYEISQDRSFKNEKSGYKKHDYYNSKKTFEEFPDYKKKKIYYEKG